MYMYTSIEPHRKVLMVTIFFLQRCQKAPNLSLFLQCFCQKPIQNDKNDNYNRDNHVTYLALKSSKLTFK